MKWSISLKNKQDKEIQLVLNYCKDWLSKYDTSKLKEIRINNGRSKAYGTFYGRCEYPNKKEKQYIVSCQINENTIFPLRRQQRRSPIYLTKDGIEIEGAQKLVEEMRNPLTANPNFELGVHCTANDGKTTWIRVYEYETYNSFDECIAAIFGHEIGHFLSRTKQIKYRNDEIQIDKFEDEFLKQYKTFKYNL